LYSPAFVYNSLVTSEVPKRKECQRGIFLSDALNLLKDKGTPTLQEMNYNGNDTLGCLIPPTASDISKAAKHKIGTLDYIDNDLRSIRYNILLGYPIIIALDVDTPFVDDGYRHAREHTPFVWHYNAARRYGYHAMICTGYNDATRLFRILNSWGDNWGDHGYFYIDYDEFIQVVNERYIAFARQPAAVSIRTMLKESESDGAGLVEGEYSSWFKVGYYRPYNGLNIGLTYLDKGKGNIIVSFTDKETKRLVQSLYMLTGESKRFVYDNKVIIFTFNRVGSAGRNPLTPAAFFTVNTNPVEIIRDTVITLPDLERICAAHSGGRDRYFGTTPFFQLKMHLNPVGNTVYATLTAEFAEGGDDHTSGSIRRYEKILELPSNYQIDSILSPTAVSIPATPLAYKGFNPFNFTEAVSPVSQVVVVGASDGNNKDDLFPGPCVDDIHTQIRRISFYVMRLRYRIVPERQNRHTANVNE